MQPSNTFAIYNASAGSGKTFNLVKEYLILLLNGKNDDAYKNILAITFTNKAVNEMKSRIVNTLIEFSDKDAIQETFVQQRGFKENALGKTDDVRSLQKKDVLEKPITGPKEVSPKGGTGKEDEIGMIDSSFYGDN